MKPRIVSLALCLMLTALPAGADYNNGPINGTVDAWTINFGYIVSDTFVPDADTVTGFMFGAWEFPGDTLISQDWTITAMENGGTVYGSGTASGANLIDQFISVNQYGYNIDKITVTGLNVAVTASATYWLNLGNAVVPSGDPVYWDENSGIGCTSPGCPSTPSENTVGSIPSESFTVNDGNGATPEPGSVFLFASGILGLAGVRRRRLF